MEDIKGPYDMLRCWFDHGSRVEGVRVADSLVLLTNTTHGHMCVISLLQALQRHTLDAGGSYTPWVSVHEA